MPNPNAAIWSVIPTLTPVCASACAWSISLNFSVLSSATASCLAFSNNNFVFNSNALFMASIESFSASTLLNKLGYSSCSFFTVF